MFVRWARLRMLVSEISAMVKTLDDNKKNLHFRSHIGGGRFVSVTSETFCVEFRKFFCPAGTDEIKPTPSGVALRLHEWWKFVVIIKHIDDANPALAAAVPCYLGDDHLNRLGCPECNPFKTYWSDYLEQFRTCLTL